VPIGVPAPTGGNRSPPQPAAGRSCGPRSTVALAPFERRRRSGLQFDLLAGADVDRLARFRDVCSPEHGAQSERVAHRVGVAVVVEVGEYVLAHCLPFPEPIAPPEEICVAVRAAVQVVLVWSV
jgi:hypothetical protein